MPSQSARYQKLSHLSKTNEGDVYTSLQFERPKVKIPWRAIRVAIALFFIGSILIIVGSLLLAGYIDKKYSDRTWPVLTLGIITFLPGFYHLRIAYYSWMGYLGYSYDDIPHYDD